MGQNPRVDFQGLDKTPELYLKYSKIKLVFKISKRIYYKRIRFVTDFTRLCDVCMCESMYTVKCMKTVSVFVGFNLCSSK